MRIAQEKYVEAKAKYEANKELLKFSDPIFRAFEYRQTRDRLIKAAGQMAKYEERVEHYMRE